MQSLEERNGEDWSVELQDEAQRLSWTLLHALVNTVRAGDSEAELHQRLKSLNSIYPSEKMWHPAKIRCGINSTKSFREISDPDSVLKVGDLFFIDIGPVFRGYEGDVGETFVVMPEGPPTTHHVLCEDAKAIWNRVAKYWISHKATGPELYKYAQSEAEARGWLLNLEGASGHRIGDFPHHINWRGSLKDFKHSATTSRWILEIQIRHPSLPLGAFYEDILKC